MIRVVVDTNILISALKTPGGTCASVIDYICQSDVSWLVSTDIVAEYRHTASRPRLKLSASAVDLLMQRIEDRALMIHPARRLSVSRDPADNRFLECAEAAEADFIITGNLRHFPNAHGVTRIVSAADFLRQLTPIHLVPLPQP